MASPRNEDIGKKKAEIARELNVSTRTLDRMVSEKRWPSDWELERLGFLLDVPPEFLLSGFGGVTPSDPPGDALEALGRRLEELEARVEQTRTLVAEGFGLQDRLRELEAERLPPRADHGSAHP